MSHPDHDVTDEYFWLVIFASIVCIGMSWGIGAIDIATSLASGIGAKAFTLKQGVLIIIIFEFSGAALLGGKVTETVRTKITDHHSFDGQEDILMLGMTSSLIAATLWLAVASRWEIPISSAHSIIGGIVGFTVVSQGMEAVEWGLLAYIALFWIISPALTACISIVFFVPMRKYLLRREDAWEQTLKTWPIFVFIVVWIGAIFIFLEFYPMEHAVWMSMSFAIGMAVFFWFALVRSNVLENYCEAAVAVEAKREEQVQAEAAFKAFSTDQEINVNTIKIGSLGNHNTNSGQSGDETVTDQHEDGQMEVDDVDLKPITGAKRNSSFKQLTSIKSLEVDVHDNMDDLEAAIHKSAEKFDPRVEKAFSILQLASASLDNFAHGSNDVANAIAPLASIWSLYEHSAIVDQERVPFWMIAGLIAGMIVGLATYGYRLIRSLGVKMTCLTNTRGYGTELSSAVIVIFASYFGFPASSAHVQVGAIVGTGIAEKIDNDQCSLKWSTLINWPLLCEMFVGWILTIVCCALLSAGLFSVMAFSPYLGHTCH